MKKILFLCFIAALFCASAYSQILEPVKWSYSVKKMNATEATVYIRATIDKGWHLYSQLAREGGPTPTKFTFTTSKSFEKVGKVIEPKPITMFEPAFMMEISYFETTAIFQQKIKLKDPNPVIAGKVEFMACNDSMCMPPTTVNFNIKVK